MERQREVRPIFSKAQITQRIALPITVIGKDLHQTIERVISELISNKCIEEGFVKDNSVKLISYSSGTMKNDKVIFDALIECDIVYFTSGALVSCVCQNITKAGIKGISSIEKPSPFIIFISRDQFYSDEKFLSIKEGDNFISRVIAQKFELGDSYISVIGAIVSTSVFTQEEEKDY